MLKMKKNYISGESCRETQKKYFKFNTLLPITTSFMTMWNTIVEPDRPQITT